MYSICSQLSERVKVGRGGVGFRIQNADAGSAARRMHNRFAVVTSTRNRVPIRIVNVGAFY